MTVLVICAFAAALGGAIVALTVVVLAATRSKPAPPSDPAARYAGDHRTVT